MKLMQLIRELAGLLSGYKQERDELLAEAVRLKTEIAEAEEEAAKLLGAIKAWRG